MKKRRIFDIFDPEKNKFFFRKQISAFLLFKLLFTYQKLFWKGSRRFQYNLTVQTLKNPPKTGGFVGKIDFLYKKSRKMALFQLNSGKIDQIMLQACPKKLWKVKKNFKK